MNAKNKIDISREMGRAMPNIGNSIIYATANGDKYGIEVTVK
jgi:hypothetical protein